MGRGSGSEPAGGFPGRGAREPTLHQLRDFLALAEELHFGRAAARVFVTQPAFSRQIRELEERLGVRLAERGSRTVEITPAGRALLPIARSIVTAMADLRRTASFHTRQLDGRLVIGSIGAEAQRPYARAVLEELRTRYPQLCVEVRSLDIATHVTALIRGEVDAAFLHPPMPPEIEAFALAVEPRVACLPADDPLAGHGSVTIAQLAGRPVVDVPSECPRVWWEFWAVDPRPDGTPVRYGPVVPDVEALFLAVARGQAMCFLPAAARKFYPRLGVSYVEVTDIAPSTAALAWLATNRDLPAIAAVRDAARISLARRDSPSSG